MILCLRRNTEHYIADLKATFQLQILGVKKNPQSPMYTQLGVMTKGTVIEVNVSELGMVTAGGKVVFGKYAQITNNPENDGCINAVLRASCVLVLLRWSLTPFCLQLSDVFCTCSRSRFPVHVADHSMYHSLTYCCNPMLIAPVPAGAFSLIFVRRR